MMSERSLVRLLIHSQEVSGKDARETKITWRGWRLLLSMLLAKENLEGVEVTVKYAACPKDLLEIVYDEIVYYLFLCGARFFI